MTKCNKNYKSSHQNSMKFHIVIARKAVGLFLDILRSLKALKGFIAEY